MKTNLNLLRRHLSFCKNTAKRKFRSRFGENESEIIEENKKKIEQIQKAAEEKAKRDAEEKVRQEKKERNKKRWQLAGKIALGAAAVGTTALFATKTQAGRNMTSSINQTIVKPVTNVVTNAATTAKSTANSAAGLVGMSSQQRAARAEQTSAVKATIQANKDNGVHLTKAQAEALISQTKAAQIAAQKQAQEQAVYNAQQQDLERRKKELNEAEARDKAAREQVATNKIKEAITRKKESYKQVTDKDKEEIEAARKTLAQSKANRKAEEKNKIAIKRAGGEAKLELSRNPFIAKDSAAIAEAGEKEAKAAQAIIDARKKKEADIYREQAKDAKAKRLAKQAQIKAKKDAEQAEIKAKELQKEKEEAAKQVQKEKEEASRERYAKGIALQQAAEQKRIKNLNDLAAARNLSLFGKSTTTLKRLCKKHKIRLTLKINGKRVPKSQKLLKKQLKNKLK